MIMSCFRVAGQKNSTLSLTDTCLRLLVPRRTGFDRTYIVEATVAHATGPHMQKTHRQPAMTPQRSQAPTLPRSDASAPPPHASIAPNRTKSHLIIFLRPRYAFEKVSKGVTH